MTADSYHAWKCPVNSHRCHWSRCWLKPLPPPGQWACLQTGMPCQSRAGARWERLAPFWQWPELNRGRPTGTRRLQEPGQVRVQAKNKELRNKWKRLPGWLCSMECSPCRMRVLAAAWVWLTGREATHTGLGWMGGLVLRIVFAFNVAELGRT